jgi:eukaryotic-like serine/threonine-protein kinase
MADRTRVVVSTHHERHAQAATMMDAGRWELVKRLFEAALGRPAGDRAAFVQSACGADPELRHEVESLLAAHADAGRFAEQPPVPPTSASVARDGVPSGEQNLLHPGVRIGAYQIRGFVASGGMGDVYRAHDLQLRRDVALKILPASFASDRDRVARFEREARLLAALNHPHIAAIYGFEQQTDVASGSPPTQALVLELVEGPTLAERVAEGALPIKEALEIARQIAEALEAAHEKGIVHRDLKPANIKVTPDGTVKVLDFGLAKAFVGEGGSTDLSQMPTLTVDRTHEGVIAGTPGYMSPEQARGQAVDKRADIWAFGCVLYEMLTARPAFPADTISDTIAAILDREPDWDALPQEASVTIRKLLRRCLAKDRRQRLSDAADARLEIEDAQDAVPAESDAVQAPRTTWRWTSIIALTALTAGLSAGSIMRFTVRPAPPPLSRFLIPLAAGDVFQYGGRHLVAFSPDARAVVYQANQGLYLRRLDQLQSTLVTGTEQGGGRSPFFSPDGQSIGFWAGGQLKRINLRGGPAVTLCSAENPWGVSWDETGTILFGQGPQGIWKVAETGGTPEVLIPVEAGAVAHGPQLLPGGEWVLFTLRPNGVSSWDAAQIVAQSLETRERKVLIEQGRDARYLPTGHLLYAVAGVLLAVPFDVRTTRVAGAAIRLVEGVGDGGSNTGAVHFSVAGDGSLVYAPSLSGPAPRVLVWIDRQGREEPIGAPPDAYLYPRLSPDGTRVALDVPDDPLGTAATLANRDIWVWDFTRQTQTRFTFDDAAEGYPVWTPDGKRLVWASQRSGPYNLYWQASDGTGPIERLTETSHEHTPYGFSPDGTRLLLREEGTDIRETLSLLTLDGDRRVMPLIRTTFNHRNGQISRDGRWLAYESDESGKEQIYIRPFPDVDSGRWQVSTVGGRRPVWAQNGRELFYQAPDGALLGVPVTVGGGNLRIDNPTKLVEGRYFMGAGDSSGRTYDVSPDGQRFLMIRDAPLATQPLPHQLVVVLNWTEELKRLVPR